MARIFIEFTKYIIILLIAIYTIITFRVAVTKPGRARNRRTAFMSIIMYLIHAISYLALYFSTENINVLILYIAQVVIFVLFSALYQVSYKQLSLAVFRNMQLLMLIGFVMITRLSFEHGVRQFAIASVSLGICLIVPLFIDRVKALKSMSYVYGIVGLGILLIVLFFGTVQNGAKNWLFIGNIKLQPSEFVKLLFVFFVASTLAKRQDIKRVCMVTVLAAAHVLVLVLERDLGGALLFFVTYLVMLYVATGKLSYLLSGLGSGCIAAIAAYFMFAHVRVRVTAFLDPFSVIEKEGYQIAQSLFAIGTGGFEGMGLTQGLPSSIPVAESDFIFSAISEEFGAIFGICLILICLSCFVMFIHISIKFSDLFYKITALGLSTLYISQVFLNIGGVIKFIPSTGVTLPLVSYGGSSILSSILMFSIIQGMYVLHIRKESLGESMKLTEFTTLEPANKLYNRTIMSFAYVFSILLLGVIGYLSYFVAVKGKTYINNSYNKRQDLLATQVIRGQILSADGKILAQTIQGEDSEEVRVYPYGNMFSHVVGRVLNGKTGIEQSESFTLLTSNNNSINQMITTLQGNKNAGDNVVTTLNAKLQKTAYEALGDHRGAIVAIEPSTGKILAMVSKPDYDPNRIIENWIDLNENPNSPLLNRVTQGLYPPGSTFKILTALEYVRENPNYKNYSYTCTSEERFHGVTIHCAGETSHGTQNLIQSFANSCNTSFANIGSSLNLDSFYKLCKSMLFNTTLPIGLKTSSSSFVLNSQSNPNDIPQTVIGLGKSQVSPIHNAMIASAIANGGILMRPYLTESIVTSEGSVVRTTKTKEYSRLLSKKEADILTEFMAEVVTSGTGTKLSNLDVTVAGKTGTADYEIGKASHAWFVGFAPVENPQIAISVIVESVGTGSKYAVPIAKQLIQAYFE